jgi:hypothetical protein
MSGSESRETKEQAELEAGREEGRQLYRSMTALFEDLPEGAEVKTREEMNWPTILEQQGDRILLKEIKHPWTGESIKGYIYWAEKGACPGSISFGELERGENVWLMPDGSITGPFIETIEMTGMNTTTAKRADMEAKGMEVIKDWLDAFKS